MSTLTDNLVDVGFNVRRAEAIEAAITGATVDAANVAFAPAGDIAATTVQAAIEELDTEKVPNTRALTAGNGLTGGGDLSSDRSFAVGAGTGISVAADAVALADMAESTIKGRAAGAGTGAPQDLTAAQVRSIISPGLVLLNSGTVTNQATLDIPLTSFTAYRALRFVLDSFVPATDDVELWLRFSTDAGANYIATGYRYQVSSIDSGGNNNGASSAAAAQILIAGGAVATAAVSNTANEGGVGVEITLFRPSAAQRTRAAFMGAFNLSVDRLGSITGSGDLPTAQDTDAVRFLFESGNIASGNWALYGYA